MKELSYYQDIENDVLERDHDRDERFAKIDDMLNLSYDLPKQFADLPGMRKYVITSPVDGINAAVRTFATLMPKFTVMPQHWTDETAQRMERMEQLLKWNFGVVNRRGATIPLWEVVESAIRYMAVAFQIEYLTGDDVRTKCLKRAGDFVYHVYNPRDVHPYYDDYGLQAVLLKTQINMKDAEKRFGHTPGYKKLLKSYGEDVSVLDEDVYLHDFTDWKDRVIWITKETTESDTSTSPFEIVNEPHGYELFPWVYRESGNPLLAAVIDGNLWEDANLMYSLQNWIVATSAAHPAYATMTLTGKGVNIGYKSPVATVALRSGESIQAIPPRQIDPNLINSVASLTERISTSIGTRYLQSFDFPANTAFSTINAFILASITNLSRARRLAETALEDGQYLMLHLLQHNNLPLTGYRMDTLDQTTRARKGEQLMASPNDYDPYTMQVSIELQADTSTDKQQKINMAIAMRQLKFPIKTIHEFLGYDNSQLLLDAWSAEQLEDAMIAGEASKIQGAAQLELQNASMQMQQQAQQPPQTDELAGEAPTGYEETQGQGFAPPMGGQNPEMANPGMGREQITGETRTGEEMAGL